MNWKDVLGQLRQEGGLPQGEDLNVEEPRSVNKAKDTLHVVVEKKGRGGKVATIIEGFTCPDSEVAELAARLKKKLGVGGSARGGEILIQGNVPEQVRNLLKAEGFKVK